MKRGEKVEETRTKYGMPKKYECFESNRRLYSTLRASVQCTSIVNLYLFHSTSKIKGSMVKEKNIKVEGTTREG